MTIRIVVDGRCLQDPHYATRGIGQHVRALLRSRHRCGGDDLFLTAVLDRDLPRLSREDSDLFDDRRTTAYMPGGESCAFLSTSPMTHSPLPMARLLMRPDVRCAAIVYDFIPHDKPQQYLSSATARIGYATCLAWLRRFDHFMPISRYTSQRLQELADVEARRCTVTGVSVRESLLPNGTEDHPPGGHVLVVGGGDARKNPEVAIIAHAGSARLAAAGVRLLIAGGYSDSLQQSLRAVHEEAGGSPALLQFLPNVADEELRDCYARALCTIAPSRIEGFSIPVIEAAANGCPVLASNCAAQAELLDDPEDLFDPDDSERLRVRLEQVALEPQERQRVRQRQANMAQGFTGEQVGRRFWEALANIAVVPAPAVLRGSRPRIAFLTPLPPTTSGVADYSFATLGPLAARAEVEVFSDTKDARVPDGVRFAGETSALAHLHPRFDAVVSVIGNSHYHLREFELAMRYGSAVLAHDARMLEFYRVTFGTERALAAASDEMGRPVELDELDKWWHEPRTLEALYLKEIAEAAHPIMVHSPISDEYIKDRYDIQAALLPFVPYRTFSRESISASGRKAVRAKLGIADDQLIIATFGLIHPVKAVGECLWALEMLRAWKMPAHLVFVGCAEPHASAPLLAEAKVLGIQDHITLFDRSLDDDAYRSWLIAADVGLQLRTYQLGGLSGAVLDCIAAGLPAVANAHLADACDSPGFIRRVPDGISAVLVAEAIAAIADEGLHHSRPMGERDAVLAHRTFDSYAERLLEAVGCGRGM